MAGLKRTIAVSDKVREATAALTARDGKVLFSRPYLDFRERYEISTSETAYFEENEVAMERLSRDVARTVVSNVLEMF